VFENLSIGKVGGLMQITRSMKTQRFAWWGPLKGRLKKMVPAS
jgi:hypothetical protein